MVTECMAWHGRGIWHGIVGVWHVMAWSRYGMVCYGRDMVGV